MSDWNKRSTNTAYRDKIEAREAQSEERTRTILRRAPPYDPLHDNAERLRRIVGLVLEDYEYAVADEDGEGMIYLPLVITPELAVQLKNAYRASMGEVGT